MKDYIIKTVTDNGFEKHTYRASFYTLEKVEELYKWQVEQFILLPGFKVTITIKRKGTIVNRIVINNMEA